MEGWTELTTPIRIEQKYDRIEQPKQKEDVEKGEARNESFTSGKFGAYRVRKNFDSIVKDHLAQKTNSN
jgi:hypothetical protein